MRMMIVSAILVALAACSTENRLLAPDHEADKIVSKEKGNVEPKKHQDHDPVCGRHLDPAEASWVSTVNDEVYFFDSEACMNQFDANPDLYRTTAR